VLGDAVTESVLGELADSVRTAARSQGYAVGWAEGRRAAAAAAEVAAKELAAAAAAAEARREETQRSAVAALGRAAEEVRGLLEELATRIEAQATDLAWQLTEVIVGREVSAAATADVVRRVLRVLPAGAVARVRLHPDHADADTVADLAARGVEIVTDDTLGPADALVEAHGAVVDLRIEEALARVREVLT